MVGTLLQFVIHLTGPDGALLDPLLEQGNFIVKERVSFGRHSLLRVLAFDQFQQKTLFQIARNHRGKTGIPSF